MEGLINTLAPEEPNVYRRSDKSTSRAPAERNVCDIEYASDWLRFAPPERGNPLKLRFYKHVIPTGRGS